MKSGPTAFQPTSKNLLRKGLQTLYHQGDLRGLLQVTVLRSWQIASHAGSPTSCCQAGGTTPCWHRSGQVRMAQLPRGSHTCKTKFKQGGGGGWEEDMKPVSLTSDLQWPLLALGHSNTCLPCFESSSISFCVSACLQC